MSTPKPPSLKHLMNEKALLIYATFLCVLILSVIILRWLRSVSKRAMSAPKVGTQNYGSWLLSFAIRKLERRLTTTWLWFGRPSYGHIVLFGIYITGNTVLSFTVFSEYRLNFFASRFGWLGASNMALCVFFGLKNTPLSLTASHAQLNLLHRLVGYTTVFLVVLHAILYTSYFVRQGRWEKLLEPGNIQGIGAGLAMLVLLMGIFRHRGYEVFYTSHILGFVLCVVMTGLHRPAWVKRLPIVMVVIGCMWTADRLIRAARMSYHLINNRATIHPLPGGATRLILKKPVHRDSNILPGSHCFLWIPQLHVSQAHPFTVVNTSLTGVELVIKSKEGFTRTLGEFATRHPGSAVLASIDGPYGLLPLAREYDKIIMIAGGSGAAFTFGFMNRLLNHSEEIKLLQSVEFVWAVKHRENLSWFSDHLQNLITGASNVRVTVYVTDETITTAPPHTNNFDDLEVSGHRVGLLGGCKSVQNAANLHYKKMNTKEIICQGVHATGSQDSVLIAACGPTGLTEAARDTVDFCRISSNCRIDIHCEDFS